MATPTGEQAARSGDDRPLEHGGVLWKPLPGATATAEEFIAARDLFTEVHKDELWNPWVMEDRAEEYEHATSVMGQWTRAEPGFRRLTEAELDARMRQIDEDAKNKTEEKERQRQTRVPEFDETRHHARLELLECDAQLRHEVEERAGLASHQRFPLMPESRRVQQIADLDRRIESVRSKRDHLHQLVGDPETVVDKDGHLPGDRREISLTYFRIWRGTEVRKLRTEVGEIEAKLSTKGLDRKERAQLRDKLNQPRSRLNDLLVLPPQTAEDMCSECARPMSWHGYTVRGWLFEIGPCPAWPNWAKRIAEAREIIRSAPKTQPDSSKPPTQKPIAVIPSGLPITDVMQRLAEIQNKHPDAEVRRGSRNKWEIWPARTTDDTT